ncbi:uncharacterized protein [Anoplolepis gracilipes]|uniref:uncharacterized protein n=1 Tax=Anoplolepis gracilipes TaxID=354296 RepID=UPI003BA34D4A
MQVRSAALVPQMNPVHCPLTNTSYFIASCSCTQNMYKYRAAHRIEQHEREHTARIYDVTDSTFDRRSSWFCRISTYRREGFLLTGSTCHGTNRTYSSIGEIVLKVNLLLRCSYAQCIVTVSATYFLLELIQLMVEYMGTGRKHNGCSMAMSIGADG